MRKQTFINLIFLLCLSHFIFADLKPSTNSPFEKNVVMKKNLTVNGDTDLKGNTTVDGNLVTTGTITAGGATNSSIDIPTSESQLDINPSSGKPVVIADKLKIDSYSILTKGNNALKLSSVGGTYNEDLNISFNGVSDELALSSTTGAWKLKLGTLNPYIADMTVLGFGDLSVADVRIRWDTRGNDCFKIGTYCNNASYSGYICIVDNSDFTDVDRSPLAISIDPVWRIYSSDADQALDYIEFFHNQTNPVIQGGNGTLILTPTYNYAADAGSTDAYVITLTGLTVATGTKITFFANTANTGACSLNVNGTGAIALKAFHDQDPPDNYIEVGSIIDVVYDGTNYQIQTPDTNP
jgi:hypothetical protein